MDIGILDVITNFVIYFHIKTVVQISRYLYCGLFSKIELTVLYSYRSSLFLKFVGQIAFYNVSNAICAYVSNFHGNSAVK